MCFQTCFYVAAIIKLSGKLMLDRQFLSGLTTQLMFLNLAIDDNLDVMEI